MLHYIDSNQFLWLDKIVLISLLLLFIAFFVIWMAGEMAIQAVEKLSGRWRLSRFTISLFALGTVAALPEISLSANALLYNSPQIAVGALLGSQAFLLFGMIPVLAIAAKGLKLQTPIQNMSLGLTPVLALIPMLALLNQSLDVREALMILAVYVVFVISFVRQGTVAQKITAKLKQLRDNRPALSLLQLLFAMAILLLAGNTVVRQVIELSAIWQMPRMLLSFLLLPIATNLPELSLVFHGIKNGGSQPEVGDFLGSITINAILLVIVTLLAATPIVVGITIAPLIWLFTIGLVAFGILSFSRQKLAVVEAIILLLFYGAFLLLATWLGYGQLAG